MIKLTYTDEMKEQDVLWITEEENFEAMKKLYQQIIKEATEKGFNGSYQIYEMNEVVIEIYENEQEKKECEDGSQVASMYGYCKALIGHLEFILNGECKNNLIMQETGYSMEKIQRGYDVFQVHEGIEVIQKIDRLESYEIQKFEHDGEAGMQALKDGYKLFTCNHEDLKGWHILDTTKNRLFLLNNGYIKSFSELMKAS